MHEFHANYQLQMARLDSGAIHEYKTAFNQLLEQIDAIKAQFVQVTNQIREKNGNGIRLPVSDYPEFMANRSESALLPYVT